MQANDARTLRSAAIPTALAGIAAIVISAAAAGGRGAVGAAAGFVLVGVFFSIGLISLDKARAVPHLFQGMAFLVYTTQLLLLAIVLAVFRGTTLFHTGAFGFSVLAGTVVWMIGQVRGHLTAKVLYVEPAPSPPATSAEAPEAGEAPKSGEAMAAEVTERRR